MTQDFNTVSYKSFGSEKSVSLLYDSVNASGYFLYEIPLRIPQGTARPLSSSARVSINGVEQNLQVSMIIPQSDNLSELNLSKVVPINISEFETNVYNLNAELTNHFLNSSIASFLNNNVGNVTPLLVSKKSEIGNSWRIGNIKQLFVTDNGDVVIRHSGISYYTFRLDPEDNTKYLSPFGKAMSLTKTVNGYKLVDKNQYTFFFNNIGQLIYERDRNNNQISYEYLSNGFLSKIIDEAGLKTQFNYINEKLSSIVNPDGKTTTLSYDSSDNLIKIINPDLTEISYSYNDLGQMISKTDENQNVTQYNYNQYGQVQNIVKPNGSYFEQKAKYDFEQEVIQESKNINKGAYFDKAIELKTTQFREYTKEIETCELIDVIERIDYTTYPRSIYRKSVKICKKRYSRRYGKISSIVSIDKPIIYNYDSNNNLSLVIDQSNRVQRRIYDNNNNLVTSSSYLDLSTKRTMEYDDTFNQLTKITDEKDRVTNFILDEKGNTVRIIDSEKRPTNLIYNSRGQVTRITDTLRNETKLFYDEITGQLVKTVDPKGNETNLGYDNSGNVNIITDPNGKVTRFEYDLMNRVSKAIAADLTETNFSYDHKGNLTSVTDSRSNTTSFEYDGLDRVVKRIDPLGRSESFSYDQKDNLLSKTDRNGVITDYTYNEDDLLIKKQVGESNITQYEYDEAGRLVKIFDSESSLEYTYDLEGRLEKTTITNPGLPPAELTNEYDEVGNRTGLLSSLGNVTYEYDVLNQLKSISALGKSFNFEYDKLGRRLSLVIGNGITTSYEYDSASRLTKMVHADTIKEVAVFGYRYDKNGNRTQMTTSRDGLTNITGVIDYGYDDINQITSATNPLQGQVAESFVYDLLGNKLRGTGDTSDSVYDLNNKLLENQNYDFGYDDSGNLISKIHKSTGETTAYFWSDENELLRIERRSSLSAPANHVVEYKYDLLGRRIEKNINGTIERYIYDNEDIIAIYDGNGDLKTQFIHGPGIDEPLAMIQDGQTYFYHTDGLGSVIALSNEAGVIQQHYVYDSFGNVSVFDGAGTQYSLDNQPIKNIYGYTSRELDSESDLYYYRARYYNPSSGRFVSEDPIDYNSQDMNLYRYVNNNSINFFDPSGNVATRPKWPGGGLPPSGGVPNPGQPGEGSGAGGGGEADLFWCFVQGSCGDKPPITRPEPPSRPPSLPYPPPPGFEPPPLTIPSPGDDGGPQIKPRPPRCGK